MVQSWPICAVLATVTAAFGAINIANRMGSTFPPPADVCNCGRLESMQNVNFKGDVQKNDEILCARCSAGARRTAGTN